MSRSDSWEETTARVKEQTDIIQVISEHVNLKRSGIRYLGLCPFHQEKTPSFSVHPGQQFYYCFGCGAAGDVFSFVMNYQRVEFKEALKILAGKCNIELPQKNKSARERAQEKKREDMYALNLKAAQLYRQYLTDSRQAEQARHYLHERGISENLQEKYMLGCAPSPDAGGWSYIGSQLDSAEKALAIELGLLMPKQKSGTYDRFRDRIMFPIVDSRGRVAGFGGRILGNENPKYLNSPESLIYNKSRLLFGLYQQRDAIRVARRAVLVEGNFDLLALVASGFEPVVAPLGTALTREQIRLLKALVEEIVLLFDGDEAGVKAAERAIPLFLAEQVSGKIAVLPQEHDPDTFVKEEGLDELKKKISGADTLPEFMVHRLVERHGVTLDGKNRIISELKPLMEAAPPGLQRSVMASHFADMLGVEPSALLAQLPGGDKRRENSPPAASRSGSSRVETRLLDKGLKSLVSYMVLNPGQLGALEEAGLQEVLEGSVGEIVYLQLKHMLRAKKGELLPEELLDEFPEGEERSLVASILLEPGSFENSSAEKSEHAEADQMYDVRGWLQRSRLKSRSDELFNQIESAQKNNDFGEISRLMKEKMKVDSELKELSDR